MTRAQAYKLVDELAEAGFSCGMAVGVYPRHQPPEQVSVYPVGVRFEAVQLHQLIAIGAAYGLELVALNGELRYIAAAEQPTSI